MNMVNMVNITDIVNYVFCLIKLPQATFYAITITFLRSLKIAKLHGLFNLQLTKSTMLVTTLKIFIYDSALDIKL